MAGETAAAKPACEHYWADHCYDGLSVRLCQFCHEPDWGDLRRQLGAAGALAHAEVQRIALRPGDRIVLRYPYHLPWATKQAIALEARLSLRLDYDLPVLVLDAGATVTVITEGAPDGR